MGWIFFILIVTLLCFSFVLLFGAPYLPTLKKQQQEALDLLDLKPGQTLLELGCGDGRMLVAAAKKNIKSVGYELNPIVFLVAKIVTFKYRKLASVKFGNFWAQKWPEVDGIYVFLYSTFMAKLDGKIKKDFKGQSVKLVSYAFKIPDKKPTRVHSALYLYKYDI